MAAFNFFEKFFEDLANGVHDLFGTDHTLKVLLTNSAPNAATHETYGSGGGSELDDLAGGNGYTKGGADTSNDGTRTGGVVTVAGVDVVFTATGAIGPFQHIVLYNDTPAGDPLIGWWTLAAEQTLGSGDEVTANFTDDKLLTIGQAA